MLYYIIKLSLSVSMTPFGVIGDCNNYVLQVKTKTSSASQALLLNTTEPRCSEFLRGQVAILPTIDASDCCRTINPAATPKNSLDVLLTLETLCEQLIDRFDLVPFMMTTEKLNLNPSVVAAYNC